MRTEVIVSVILSPTGAQPGMLMTGSPNALRYSLPRKSMVPMALVTLPWAAGTPPQVAQVPTANTAAAFGAKSRSILDVGYGRQLPSSSSSLPMADQ